MDKLKLNDNHDIFWHRMECRHLDLQKVSKCTNFKVCTKFSFTESSSLQKLQNCRKFRFAESSAVCKNFKVWKAGSYGSQKGYVYRNSGFSVISKVHICALCRKYFFYIFTKSKNLISIFCHNKPTEKSNFNFCSVRSSSQRLTYLCTVDNIRIQSYKP